MEFDQSTLCEIEVSYNPIVKPSQRPKINSAEDAYRILRQAWDENKINMVEEFKVMLLDRQNKVLGQLSLFQGGLSSMAVDPKIVFAVALKSLASQIIVAHNHPSGNLKASHQDIGLTKKLVQIGLLHDLPVIDHLIVTSEGYCSFSNEGMMPS